jgi:hypothetical protein
VKTDSGLIWSVLQSSELSEEAGSAHGIAVVISEVIYDYLRLDGISIFD